MSNYNIQPTSTLTPRDIVETSGIVTCNYRDSALNEQENFKRLGSFWLRQMSPKGKQHAKSLACLALKTNALSDVQNVKNNLGQDNQNLFFSDIITPIEYLLPVIDYDDAIAAIKKEVSTLKPFLLDPDTSLSPENCKHYAGRGKCNFFIWRIKSGYNIDNIRIRYGNTNITQECGVHFKQIGQWVILCITIPNVDKDSPKFACWCSPISSFDTCLCSGSYDGDSYFGQSFYKPLLNLEYLQAGPGAQFTAEYISGKHQDLRSLEVMLNTVIGLPVNFGRNTSEVISVDVVKLASDPLNDAQSEQNIAEDESTKMSHMILKDKITDDIYSLQYFGDVDPSIEDNAILSPNVLGSYLVQLAIKPTGDGPDFKRVTAHAAGKTIDIKELSSLAIEPANPLATTFTVYQGEELENIISHNLDTGLVIHLGDLYKWEQYFKYKSSRSDHFKNYFKSYKDLISYIIRIVKDYAPLTYTPIFTCTYTLNGVETTSDYNLYLYRSNDNS